MTLPEDLWARLKRLPLRRLGYASPTEVAREAIREKCQSMETRGPGRRSR